MNHLTKIQKLKIVEEVLDHVNTAAQRSNSFEEFQKEIKDEKIAVSNNLQNIEEKVKSLYDPDKKKR